MFAPRTYLGSPASCTGPRAMVLAALAAELMFEDAGRARALAGEARAVAARLDDPAVELRVLNLTHIAMTEPASLAARVESATRAGEFAVRLADPVGTAFASLYRAWTLLETGDLDGFERALDAADGYFAEAYDLAHRRLRSPYWTAQTQLGWATALRARGGAGDEGRAAELLAAARVTCERHGFATVGRRVDAAIGQAGTDSPSGR